MTTKRHPQIAHRPARPCRTPHSVGPANVPQERTIANGIYVLGIALLGVGYFGMRDQVASELLLGIGVVTLLKLRFLSQWLARRITRHATDPADKG